MNGKKIIHIKFLSIFLIAVLLMSVKVRAATYTLQVNKFPQEKSNWCWAACASMVGDYLGNYRTQSDICRHLYNEVIDHPATHEGVTKAIRFASQKSVLFSGVISFPAYVTNMKNKKPVVLRWQKENGGHLFVVSGVSEAYGGLTNRLYLIDPKRDVYSAYFGYEGLKNGMTLASGKGYYSETWTIIS
ncbi:MAG: hypothetical protein HFH32_18755 [Eubacterium sp.]|jgi:hypothetical protein|nr:hypothetical protein [Eubacterium sp.]